MRVVNAMLMKKVGKNIKALRKLSGMTQDEAAHAASKMATRNYQDLEYGKGNPTLETLEDVVAAFGSHIGALFGYEPKDKLTEDELRLLRGYRLTLKYRPNKAAFILDTADSFLPDNIKDRSDADGV